MTTVMQVDRMALADLGNPTAIAEAVLKQLGTITNPIPVTEIAFASGHQRYQGA